MSTAISTGVSSDLRCPQSELPGEECDTVLNAIHTDARFAPDWAQAALLLIGVVMTIGCRNKHGGEMARNVRSNNHKLKLKTSDNTTPPKRTRSLDRQRKDRPEVAIEAKD